MNKRSVGSLGEALARDYLEAYGYSFVDKNVFLSRGEIDLIMTKESCLYFIEVKYRRTMKFGSPRESMTPAKIKRLKHSVSEYLYRNKAHGNPYKISFMGIQVENDICKYDWLESIF